MSLVTFAVRVSARRRAVVLQASSIAILLAFGGFIPVLAERTRFWRQSDYENFDRGSAKGTAVRSDGRIMLAPKFTPLADVGLAYLWDLKVDSRGNLYAAGGSNAKVVKVDSAKTVQGQNVTVKAMKEAVKVNNANVVKTDIVCSNGVIHVIDAVLLPPKTAAN